MKTSYPTETEERQKEKEEENKSNTAVSGVDNYY